jgi:hypothetical protein
VVVVEPSLLAAEKSRPVTWPWPDAASPSLKSLADDAFRLHHCAKASEQKKLDMLLRRAITVGIEDWRRGRVDDRSIDKVLWD